MGTKECKLCTDKSFLIWGITPLPLHRREAYDLYALISNKMILNSHLYRCWCTEFMGSILAFILFPGYGCLSSVVFNVQIYMLDIGSYRNLPLTHTHRFFPLTKTCIYSSQIPFGAIYVVCVMHISLQINVLNIFITFPSACSM
jgi:hypothetical protein